MQKIFVMVAATATAGMACADEVKVGSGVDFYYGQILFEHTSCGIQYIAVDPATEYLYIHEQLAAIIDYRGEPGIAKGISTLGTASLEVAGSFDPVFNYLDEVLISNGLPQYRELSETSCLSG